MVHGISTESTRILKGILLDPGIRYLSTDQSGLNAHTQNFSLRTQWFMVYLPNLPGLWRVSCWTQGLGIYLPINLDLNAHIPKFWLRNSRIGWFTESTRILQGILLDPGIRYISTDLPWFLTHLPQLFYLETLGSVYLPFLPFIYLFQSTILLHGLEWCKAMYKVAPETYLCSVDPF